MDPNLLFYTLLILWIMPFTFGSDRLNVCMNGKLQKKTPGPESHLHSQCEPWKKRSCCTNQTARSVHEDLHHNFNFDHCSQIRPMSSECKRHFIQDLCFYECSPNVGPWIVTVNMTIRKERFYKVPLCRSDCESWFDACRYDYTCSSNWLQGWNWTKKGNVCNPNSTCLTFQTVFSTADNFCKKVWDGSWQVSPDYEPCMKLWFNPDLPNPNDDVAMFYSSSPALGCIKFLYFSVLLFLYYYY